MENDNLLKSLKDLLSDLKWLDEELSTDLNKGPNYYKDKDPAKYKKMLAKLSSQRKTPGHKERGYQQVLQAKRREKGGAGTKSGQNGKSGHASGHMKTKTGSAAKRYASAEKKHGKKMSMNRKNNNKGYASGNVELISQKYNQGDEKYSKKAPEKNKKLKKTIDLLKSKLLYLKGLKPRAANPIDSKVLPLKGLKPKSAKPEEHDQETHDIAHDIGPSIERSVQSQLDRDDKQSKPKLKIVKPKKDT
jgi:hypothetical protein